MWNPSEGVMQLYARFGLGFGLFLLDLRSTAQADTHDRIPPGLPLSSGSVCGRGQPSPALPVLPIPSLAVAAAEARGDPGRAGGPCLPATGPRTAMEAQAMPAALQLVAGGGAGLSPEQRAALAASLLLLQRDYRFERVWFWGCIRGVRGAYYIAEGLGPDCAAPRSRLYRCGAAPGSRGRRVWGCAGPGVLSGSREGASLCPQGPGEVASSPVLEWARL